MSCPVVLQGSIALSGDCGCSGGGGGATKSQPISIGECGCGTAYYDAVKSTDCQVPISTPGLVGSMWVDLPVQLSRYDLLFVECSAPVALRLDPLPAQLVGAALPTVAESTELAFTIDGNSIVVHFVAAGPIPAVEAVRQINAAAVSSGLDWLPASLVGGQFVLTGARLGVDGYVNINVDENGIFGENAGDNGSETKLPALTGVYLAQFAPSSAPKRVQISGQARVSVFAAGVS